MGSYTTADTSIVSLPPNKLLSLVCEIYHTPTKAYLKNTATIFITKRTIHYYDHLVLKPEKVGQWHNLPD